jgi:hypothetical protein
LMKWLKERKMQENFVTHNWRGDRLWNEIHIID